ncbi:DEKNAAC101683 [Brettanomyces naardenensis]|uniref:Putative lipoate-protein ligase A n=1 Tax=Brettanomyces naardenensis TaxID=13370 RepID=A0A448YIQ8_BRENA|nr:DEKNAAC101683 [Brettanomyces naardenensis]
MLRCLLRAQNFELATRGFTTFGAYRSISSQGAPFNGLPHHHAVTSDTEATRQQLELDPNLEGFFDDDLVESVKKGAKSDSVDKDFNDLLDPSEVPILGKDDIDPSTFAPHSMPGSPVTMTTEEFLSQLKNQKPIQEQEPIVRSIFRNTESIKKNDPPLPTTSELPELPESFHVHNFERFIDFMHRGDIPTPKSIPKNASLESLVESDLPVGFISRFNDPRLNLSIERYIYKHLPDPKNNRFAKRLVLYRNSPCIVIGKNQNPYKEINFRMANMYKIPILRRYSGGGTVVHDLGNVNFSFIADKSLFNRTGFSNILVERLNALVGKTYLDYNLPRFILTTNSKGDIVDAGNMHKVSGSAYQLSGGRSLHHGTMLLNVNMKLLSGLLKLSKETKKCVEDRCIDSVPSPVENVNMDEEVFEYSCVNAFASSYGVPSFLKRPGFDNVDVLKFGNSECQVVKVDDLDELPQEVIDEYNTFKSWEWVFGRTPKFKLRFQAGDELEVCLHIDHGKVKEMELSRDEPKLDRLSERLGDVLFRGDKVAELIDDNSLRRTFAWNIDQMLDYEGLGVSQ